MRDATARKAVWGLVLVYFLFFGLLVFLKSRIYQNADDTPLYTQALWSTLQGRPYAMTWLGAGGPGGLLLGLHLELTLILLAPLYALWPSPDPLLLVQVLFVALTAHPIYACAVHLLKKPSLGLCFAAAHLANPHLQRAHFYDFHHEFLVYCALSWAASLLIRERYRLFLLAALVAALTREDALVQIFALGLFAAGFKRRLRLGVGVATVSLVGFLVATSVVVSYFRHEPNRIFAARYPELGADIDDVARTVLLQPGLLLDAVSDPDNLLSLIRATFPLAFLPLLSLPGILLMAPAIAATYLTTVPSLKHLELLYPFVVMPLYPYAALVSLSRLTTGLRAGDQLRRLGSLLVLALSVGSMLLFPSDYNPAEHRYHAYYLKRFPLASGFSWEYFLPNDHERTGRRFIAEHIPPEIPLATEYRFAAHLSNRSVLKPLKDLSGVEIVFLDLHGRPYVSPIGAFLEILRRPDFGVVAFDDGYTLLRRGADPAANQLVLAHMSRRFEAEEFGGDTGAYVADHQCTNRTGRAARAGSDGAGILVSAPTGALAAGAHVAHFRLKARPRDGAVADQEIAVLEVRDPASGEMIARRTLTRADFAQGGRYEGLSLPFVCEAEVARVELRVVFRATADLWADRIELASPENGALRI